MQSWSSKSYFLLGYNLSIHLCLQITFDNKAHSGKIKIYFDSDANIEECKNLNISGFSKYVIWLSIVDYGYFLNIYFGIWSVQMVYLDGDRKKKFQKTTSWAFGSVQHIPKLCIFV